MKAIKQNIGRESGPQNEIERVKEDSIYFGQVAEQRARQLRD